MVVPTVLIYIPVYSFAEVVDSEEPENASSGLDTTLLVLIILTSLLVILAGVFIFIFVFRRQRNNSKQQQYEVSGYVNTSGAESFKME